MASPSIARATLQRGPGSLLYGAALKMFSQEDITASVKPETWRAKVSTHGETAPRLSDVIGEVTFTPTGRISTDLIAGLYPAGFRNPTVGARVFPASDTALLIHGIDQSKLQFTNAALTKMPDLTLSPKATAFGQATYTALIKDNTPRETVGSFYTTPTAAAWAETFDDDDIVAVPYAGAWNSISILTEDGWKVSFEVQMQPVYVDGIGTVDYEITGVTARATCKPVNMTAAVLMTQLRPEGLALGSSLRQTKNLVITGTLGGLIVTLYDAALMEAPAVWSPGQPRAGEIGFEASRVLTGVSPNTTMGAVFEIAIAAA